MHAEILPTINDNEIRRIACTQQADLEAIVLHGIDGCAAEHVETIGAERERAADMLVEVAEHQEIGMQVVAAEHAPRRVGPEQWRERGEVARGGTLADENFHARGELVLRFCEGETLVVGRDAGGGVAFGVLAAQAGRVAVNLFAEFLGGGDHR